MKIMHITGAILGMLLYFMFAGQSPGSLAQEPPAEVVPPPSPATPYPGFCFVRDRFLTCQSLIGDLEINEADQCEHCTTPGEPCSGDRYALPNPGLTVAQYKKTRAISYMHTDKSGYAHAVSNALICGTIGVCDQDCEEGMSNGQYITLCPVDAPNRSLVFFDLYGECEPWAGLSQETPHTSGVAVQLK